MLDGLANRIFITEFKTKQVQLYALMYDDTNGNLVTLCWLYLGLAKTIHTWTWYTYGIFGRDVTKHTVTHGVSVFAISSCTVLAIPSCTALLYLAVQLPNIRVAQWGVWSTVQVRKLSRILLNPKNAVRELLKVHRVLGPSIELLGPKFQPKMQKRALHGNQRF